MRDLGDLGELKFNSWCSEIGLIANKSTKDKMGWDFIVEFPFSNKISGIQIHQSAPKCKVQVKATDGQKRLLSVSLSNLRKLAVDPLPCFYIFIEFDQQNEPERAFLRHTDEELIEKVLETISTKDNQTYTVHYDESHQLNELTGQCLAEKIKSYIGKDLADYVHSKKSFLENVGYEDDRLEIKFDLIGKENLEELIDVHLGLKENARISNLSAVEKRFGILHEKTDLSSESAKLSLPDIKPTTKAKLIFRKGKISNDYRFDVDVYFPSFLNDFNHPLFKSRYKANFFDLIIKHNSKKLGFKFDLGNKTYALRELRNALKFIESVTSGDSYKVLLKNDNGQEVLGSINSSCRGFDYTKNINTLNTLIRLTQLFGVTEDVFISFDEMNYLDETAPAILDFYQARAERYRISFDVKEDELKLDDDILLLGVVAYRIGGFILYALYSAEGKVVASQDKDRNYEVYGPKVNILDKLSASLTSPLSIDEIYDELGTYESDFDDKPLVILRE